MPSTPSRPVAIRSARSTDRADARRSMRVLVAPSGFKECLSAEAVADAIAVGVRRVLPNVELDIAPLVDGGEGSAATMATASGGRLVDVRVTGPVGEPVDSHFAILGDGRTALVEMAAAAGLRLVPRDRRDPGFTTSTGVGELIRAALDHGCERIIVGCGDSGICDGGAGALRALGAELRDEHGVPVAQGGAALLQATALDLSGLDPRLTGVTIEVAGNMHNILTGPRGVARVFGPQKGATPDQVEQLADAMDHWAALLHEVSGVDLALLPGGGASGGLGAGLAGGLGAQLRSRFDVLLGHVRLDERLAAADLVITAEGSVDAQTPKGKIPAEVGRRAKLLGRPVVALAGTIGAGAGAVHEVGIDAVAGILAGPIKLGDALDRGAQLLADGAERALRLVLVGMTLGTEGAAAGSTGDMAA